MFKSVLKLDKNFHNYIHRDRNKIEQAVDEKGRKYYNIYNGHASMLQPFFQLSNVFKTMTAGLDNPLALGAVLTAAHVIRVSERFRAVLEAAAAAAAEGHIALLGITPTEPNTGYGYIETNGRIGGRSLPVLRVASFKEKPTEERAREFLASENFFWNSGMFVWSLKTIQAEMRRLMPDLAERVASIGAAWDTPQRDAALNQWWEGIRSETIDYGVIERAADVVVIPADIGWNDVGSWAALFDVLPSDKDDNIVEGEYISVDSRNNLIYSPNRLVAAIGVEDLVIVDTDDVILILPRNRAQDVRHIVAELRKRGRIDVL